MQNSDLATISSPKPVLPRPIEELEKLPEYFETYSKVCNQIVKQEDRQKIPYYNNGKQEEKWFTKKSGWTKLATVYNVSTKRSSAEERTDRLDGSFFIKAHVVAYNLLCQREVEEIGTCDSREFPGSDKKIEHDVSSKAYTR
jgi:hypothetical protein